MLTNGQHFTEGDMEVIEALGPSGCYGASPSTVHLRQIMTGSLGKTAHMRLLSRIWRASHAGASIELRTVVIRSNVEALPELAQFITTRLPALQVWAIMQMERIGYGRLNWEKEFCDTSLNFYPVGRALDVAAARGLPVSLYNFPLCTVPPIWRDHAMASISDWKQKFINKCQTCTKRPVCSGFFLNGRLRMVVSKGSYLHETFSYPFSHSRRYCRRGQRQCTAIGQKGLD